MKKNDIEEYENKKLKRMTKKEEFDYIVYKILGHSEKLAACYSKVI